MTTVSDYRDPWRERMRLEEIKRNEKNRTRKEWKPATEMERKPWPVTGKITPDEAWRRRS